MLCQKAEVEKGDESERVKRERGMDAASGRGCRGTVCARVCVSVCVGGGVRQIIKHFFPGGLHESTPRTNPAAAIQGQTGRDRPRWRARDVQTMSVVLPPALFARTCRFKVGKQT